MAATEDWCSDKVSKLLNEDLRIPTLNEIKEQLSSVSQEEATVIARHFHLSSVFDCLNDSNVEQVDLACEVLTLCMSHLSLGDSTRRYNKPLERALNHPFRTVKLMALKEIHRNIMDENLLVSISKESSLMNSIILCVGDTDLAVAKNAADIIYQIGIVPSGLQQLISPNSLKSFQDVSGRNEVIKLRVNEVFIDIARHSEESMYVLVSVELFSQILEDIDNNDVLFRMNVIELISRLVTTKHGYDYLELQGIITKIINNMENTDTVISQLCKPGILKFFGHMAHWKPMEIISKYPSIINELFSVIQEDDLLLLGVALDILGHIAETNEGKFALESTGNKMSETIQILRNRMASLTFEYRIRSLNCLESLFKIKEFDSRVTNLIKKWYLSLGDNPMEWIYKLAQNPFSEFRLAALGVVTALASHHWGQECFRNTPGFIEYLLDRRSEIFKECKEVKYNIVKILSNSSVFDHSTQLRLQVFVREGPFYVQTITEVAVEGND